MLVLSRKLGETICIGNDIAITVVEIKGNRIRLGVEAPKPVTILRGELQEARDFPEPTEAPPHFVLAKK